MEEEKSILKESEPKYEYSLESKISLEPIIPNERISFRTLFLFIMGCTFIFGEKTCFIWIIYNKNTNLWLIMFITALFNIAYYAVYIKFDGKNHIIPSHQEFKINGASSYIKIMLIA